MSKHYDPTITRRAVMKLGLTSAALATVPLLGQRKAWADAANPHLVVTFHSDGGWDPTQVLDPHDPLDQTDGVDVDVPQLISGLPPSQIVTMGDLTYVSNPTTRPNVDAFFAAWGGRTAIVNGISTRSTSHDQSTQLVHTGYLDPSRGAFSVLAADRLGRDLPLPHLLLSGPSFGGQFAGLSGRVGSGALAQAMAYNQMSTRQQAVSAVGEGYIQQALARLNAIESGPVEHAISGRLGQYTDAQSRADRLARFAQSLPRSDNGALNFANSLGNAFRQGLTTSVTVGGAGGFDTHNDNTQQNMRWENVFGFLKTFVDALAAQPGVLAPSLLDETTIVHVSDFGRTPQLNGDNGKDHHPWTSTLLVGKRVRPGTFGLTDREQEGVTLNFDTGRPDDAGAILDVTNMVAGLVALVGGNPGDYLPGGVRPFTAMINA
jgi:uncharacterized protein (DUF1501 family)